MSVQSDTEMLSVSAVEEYATQNHMTVDATYELFHRHQIFEKIILQHEYLHQVSMDEVMDFIYKEIQDEEQDLILFHGDGSALQCGNPSCGGSCKQTSIQ